VLAADRDSLTGFLFRTTTGQVPASSVAVDVELHMEWRQGLNDGYADSLSFTLVGR
jgi:hypothetical protein